MSLREPSAQRTHDVRPGATLAQRLGSTYGEAHRHACEVRMVVGMASRHQRAAYLLGVEQKRGAAAAQRLREDVQQLWSESAAARAKQK